MLGAAIALGATIGLAIDTASNNYSLIGSLTFGLSLIFLLVVSTLLHGLDCSLKWQARLERLDYVAIYLFIAGTYTPVCLKVIPGSLGTYLLIGQWVLAFLGCLMVYAKGLDSKKRQVTIYILLGWSFLIAARTIFQNLNNELFIWLVSGGLLYSVGSLFFLSSVSPKYRLGRWDHGVWHLFVLAGSYCHFQLVAGICLT